MSNTGNNFFAFLVGACIGGFLGICYAPERGRFTRDRFYFQIDKYKRAIEAFIQDMLKDNKSLSNKAKEDGEALIKDAKEKAEKLLGDVDTLITRIKKK